MMATAVSKANLLDLSFLTTDERAKLEAVIKADQNLLMRDRVRVGTLRQELEKERHFQHQLQGKPQCTCCERKLGIIFNSGAPCPSCLYRVCKQCRVMSHKPPPPFLCPVCVKKRLVDIQAADYSSVPTASFSPSPLFGSQLVMMSLEAKCTGECTMANPYNGKARKGLLPNFSRTTQAGKPRSGTNESSIVVRYERSDSVMSDAGSVGSGRERPNSLPARRISPNDFSNSDDEDEEEERRTVLEVPGLSKMRHSESISSIGSLTSMYSDAGGKGDYAISGEIYFGVWYSRDGLLKVHIDRARNLAAARKEGYSYPYVKVYLLPDRSKQTKRKTGFVRKTVSPKYDETLKYKMSESELSSRTLWLSVWDWDRFGRNQFLGELRLPLNSLDLTDSTDHWHTLMDQDESAQMEVEGQYRGRLKLGLMFQLDPESSMTLPPQEKRKVKKKKGVLHVAIKQAEDLPKMDAAGLANAVAKCYLLPSRTSSNKRKTKVVMNSIEPVWDEEFVYKCSLKELAGERVLEVTIWDFDKRGSNDFIGGLRIGPAPNGTSQNKEWMDSIEEEAAHWKAMLAQPGEWVEQWHTLRPRMDRSIYILPQKPTRELSPVQETLSPTMGEEEVNTTTQASAPSLYDTKASSLSSATHVSDSTSADNSRSKPYPLKSSDKPNASNLSPLSQSKNQHKVPTVKADVSRSRSRSPSPIPELLVTSETAGIPRSPSASSIHSAYSDNETGRGDYDITGEIQIGIVYKGGKLLVHVNRARGLAAADSNGFSDPYVKTYLLPDRSKHSKRKTNVQRKTLSPIFDETLEYSVSESELSSRTLWLSVWDWDRFGRNQFLGEIKVSLKSLNLRNDTELWYTLVDKDQPYNVNPNSGQLQLALKFAPKETESGVTRGTLSVQIQRACNLTTSEEETGKPDPYVKCSLLPSAAEQRKTAVVKNSSSPSWRESFLFESVSLEELARGRVLEVTVWDFNRGTSNDFIGGLHIGPAPSGTSRDREWMDSIQEEAAHWEAMLAHPGEWTERWHTLRKTMEPRSADLSAPQSNNSQVGDEFRKVVSKSSSASPRESPVLSVCSHSQPPSQQLLASAKKQDRLFQHTSSPLSQTKPKPVENRFPELGSNPSLPRSASPLASTQSHSSIPNAAPYVPPSEISTSNDPLSSRSVSPEVSSGDAIERSPNQKPPAGPLKRAGLLGVKHSGSHSSFGSQLSIYSAAGGGKGNYDITGEVLVGISYNGGKLLVHVNRARDLAAADSNGSSDPYVKTYLLPDRSKHSKRKTNIQRKTVNPTYEQTLVYKLPKSELSSRTLWLSVWDWDRFGRNQFLGELRLPLNSLDLTDNTDHWHTLMDKDEEPEAMDYYRGQLHLALRFSPRDTKKGKTRGLLEIIIKQGRDFPSMGGNEKPDPVVKCYLLPDKSSSGKRKAGVIKNQNNPMWDELISYEKVVLEEISKERVLEVTVWDWDKKGSSFIGGLRIGPTPSGPSQSKEWMDSIGEEATHWETMLVHPGEWVEQWHTLRTTMDPRNIAFQDH